MAALGAEARAALLGRRGDPEAAAAGLAAALGLGAYRTAPREAAVVDLYVQAAECAPRPPAPPPRPPPPPPRARAGPAPLPHRCLHVREARSQLRSAGTRVRRDARGRD